MFIRAYLRASTVEQDAERAKQQLIAFAADRGHRIASFYVEHESGAKLERPELMRLISDAGEQDILLVEQIDRLARLNQADWLALKRRLAEKQLAIVSPERPTSWIALSASEGSEFTVAILQAVNCMLLDMLAAVARKDYDDRRRRQQAIAIQLSRNCWSARDTSLRPWQKRQIHHTILALYERCAEGGPDGREWDSNCLSNQRSVVEVNIANDRRYRHGPFK